MLSDLVSRVCVTNIYNCNIPCRHDLPCVFVYITTLVLCIVSLRDLVRNVSYEKFLCFGCTLIYYESVLGVVICVIWSINWNGSI